MLQEAKQFLDEWRRGMGEWHTKELFSKLLSIIEDQQSQINVLRATTTFHDNQITQLQTPPVKDKK